MHATLDRDAAAGNRLTVYTRSGTIGDVDFRVALVLDEMDARWITIDAEIGKAAVNAFDRYGNGRHRAALNMGDCFSYACAKVHGLALLYKGDDFAHTDIEAA